MASSQQQKTVLLHADDLLHLYDELSKMSDEQPFTGTLEVSSETNPFNLKRVLTHRMSFKDGKLHGVQEGFYENGDIKVSVHYKDDKQHGVQEEFYVIGNLQTIQRYKDGQLHGIREEFFENGKLKKRDRYKNDQLHGVCELFDHNGELYLRTQYKKGKIQN